MPSPLRHEGCRHRFVDRELFALQRQVLEVREVAPDRVAERFAGRFARAVVDSGLQQRASVVFAIAPLGRDDQELPISLVEQFRLGSGDETVVTRLVAQRDRARPVGLASPAPDEGTHCNRREQDHLQVSHARTLVQAPALSIPARSTTPASNSSPRCPCSISRPTRASVGLASASDSAATAIYSGLGIPCSSAKSSLRRCCQFQLEFATSGTRPSLRVRQKFRQVRTKLGLMAKRHSLGITNGYIMENDDGTASYFKTFVDFLPAFTARISDVTGFSETRGAKGWARNTLHILGEGREIGTCDINVGVTPKIEEWFRAHPDFGGNRQAATSAEASPVSVADELTKLAALRDSGVLTHQEFDQQKAKLLGA